MIPIVSVLLAILSLSTGVSASDEPTIVKKTHVYKTVGDCQVRADVHRLPGDDIRPGIVWIHGGALIMGSRDVQGSASLREQFTRYMKAGYTVISIDYRLAPETKLDGIIEDLKDAFKWVRAKGPAELRIDPDRLAVVGHSAGGYLTLMAGFCVEPRPKALVAFYGYGDIIGDWYKRPDLHYSKQKAVPKAEAYKDVGRSVISESTFNVDRGKFYLYCRQNGLWPKEVVGHDPDKEADKFARFCPVQNVTKDYPPTLLLHGDKDTDVPYEQSVVMARELQRHGVVHKLITMPGGGHGFDSQIKGKPEVSAAFDAALAFLTQHVSVAPQVHRDLAYVEPKNERQTLDVYSSAEGKGRPVVFWIHGGGWQRGNKTDVQIKPQAFVDKGFVFVSTNYRFVPNVTIKQMAGDIAKAIRWVHDHAGQYGGDPDTIFVMGHSAGAQLAALVCTDDRCLKAEGLSLSIIRGCVPVDGDTYDVPMQIRTVKKRIADIYRWKFGDEASQKDLSPVTHVAKGKRIPAFLILHVADHPETKAQSQRLAKLLQEVGITARAFPAEGKNHTTINADLGLPGDKPTQALFEFLGTLVGTARAAEPSRSEVPPSTKAAPQDRSAAGAGFMFLFSYFLGNGEDGLHLASSRDGYHWTALNQGRSFLAPQAGHKLMRDPCLLRGPDGVFHLVWTTGWGDRVIGYANSRDLIHWSPQQAIPVMMHEPTARNAWAPELFYDDEHKQFLIFWASTIPGRFPETDRTGDDGWNHRIYATTTLDFKTFTPTRLFFDAGFNVIDATILKARGQYYLIVKDETKTPVKKNLRIARSAKAEGPYQDVSAPISISWVEGPSSIQLGDEFLIYLDHYAAPQYYGALRSKDLVHWEDVSKKVDFPQGTRHGTVLRVSEEVVTRLQ